MMRRYRYGLGICLSFLLAVVTIQAVAESVRPAGTDSLEPPILKDPLFLLVPRELWPLSSDWGNGLLRLRLGADGKVEDWIPIELPHYKLLKAIGRALEWAEFEPAFFEGEAVPVDITVTIPLNNVSGYAIISQTITENVQSRMSQLMGSSNRLVLSSPGQLDQPLELQESGQSVIYADDQGNPITGTTTVEFYIDPEGHPRMARARGEPDPFLAEAAVRNVREFHFNRPTRNGRPTVVRARVPVVIGKEG